MHGADHDCREVRQWLERGESPDAALQEGARGCPHCRTLLAATAPVAVLDALTEARCPEAMRARVLATLQGHVSPHQAPGVRERKRRWVLAAAAVMLVAAGAASVGVWVDRAPRHAAKAMVAAMVDDHMKLSQRADRLELPSRDPARVTDWLRGYVGAAVKPAALRGAELVGARRCALRGRKVALLFYELPDRRGSGRVASLFVMNDRGADYSYMKRLRGHYCREHRRGLSAVVWHERGLTYALVSDLDDAQLVDLLPEQQAAL